MGRTTSQARGILSFVYGSEYVDCPEFPNAVPKSGNAFGSPETEKELMVQAVPNPAKFYTSFKYNLPKNVGSCRIEVHNMAGYLVQVFSIQEQQGEVIWDTRGVKPGIYVYTLKTPNALKTGKLVVSR
jgi:hypothetical protein